MLINLKNKKILLGVTGSIAVYKAVEIVRLLKAENAEVKVVMTENAQKFVQPLTFSTLSGNCVYTKMFQQDLSPCIEHISLARWADVIFIAPATANIIAKLTYGIADDLLSTVCLATTSPICIAPAMNKEMWSKQITQDNVELLQKRGVKFFGPVNGELACGEIGSGKMLEPSLLVEMIASTFTKPILKGKKIIITAGPTIEPIDPVRFVSNYSSGKMGYAIACAARDYGAEVLLISGPTKLPVPFGVKIIKVDTALQMFDAVMKNIDDCDIFISAAAVADYRVESTAEHKIKKNADTIQLNLIKNPDILVAVAALKKPPITIGFAAETENVIENAKKKLASKKVDMIAANLVGNSIGFDSDENTVTLITKSGKILEFGTKSKDMLAHELLELWVNDA